MHELWVEGNHDIKSIRLAPPPAHNMFTCLCDKFSFLIKNALKGNFLSPLMETAPVVSLHPI